jgi:hypothetical protein
MRHFVTSLVLLVVPLAAEEPQEPLNNAYVQHDLQAMDRLRQLQPFEQETPKHLATVFEVNEPDESNAAGFDGTLFSVRKGHGYTTLFATGFTVRGRLAWLRIGIEGGDPTWDVLREREMAAWTRAGGPAYTCDENECVHEWRDESVLNSYRESVALALGAQRNVDVPDALKRYYNYLLLPFENTVVAPGSCGLPMPGEEIRPVPGREAINALAKARRIDLIENVLRGYNPGGRIYALLALQKLRRLGVRISPATTATMRKVYDLDVAVSTCRGCFRYNEVLAPKIVREWRKNGW